MKKLDDKIISNDEQLKFKENKEMDISCDCCSSETSQSPSSTLSTSRMELTRDDKGEEEKEKESHQQFQRKYSGSLNEKLLIVIGISLTIPIVLLQILLSDSYHLTNLLCLALATSVQILLGIPFYKRFIRAVRYKKRFTTDTLVVLSTTVAYLYSLISVVTGSYIQFFEASSSVLTIFTIGEYLENRILKTTSESIRSLLALKPKKAVVIRNDGKGEQMIDADNIVVGDIVVTKPGEKIA
jgi:Cu+-exporting ATPase